MAEIKIDVPVADYSVDEATIAQALTFLIALHPEIIDEALEELAAVEEEEEEEFDENDGFSYEEFA